MKTFLLALGLAAALIFPMLTRPNALVFDEFHYVRAANHILAHEPTSNWEHPPHAKQWIAFGIALFGDEPFGWRFFGAILGVFSMGLLYILLRQGASFTPFDSICAVMLTLLSFPHFVLSRTAMLDVYFVFYSLLAAVFMVYRERFPQLLWASAFSTGLALACKWSALFLILPLLCFSFLSTKQASKLLRPKAAFGFCVMVLLGYFVTFFGETPNPLDWPGTVLEMWDGQRRVRGPHPYTSEWWQWSLLLRPMWLYFSEDPEGSGFARGVFLGGNPLLFWLGALAAPLSALFFKRRAPLAWIWIFLTLIWAVVPRKISFFHYVYPASLFLGPLLVEALVRITEGRTSWIKPFSLIGLLLGSGAVFAYFYPVLTAHLIEISDLPLWMWFRSWN